MPDGGNGCGCGDDMAFGLFHLAMVCCGHGGLDVGLVQAVSRCSDLLTPVLYDCSHWGWFLPWCCWSLAFQVVWLVGFATRFAVCALLCFGCSFAMRV